MSPATPDASPMGVVDHDAEYGVDVPLGPSVGEASDALEEGAMEPIPIDLVGGGQVMTGAFPSLAILDDRSASLFATELSHALQANVEVVPESSDVMKLHLLQGALECPGCLNHVQFEGLGGHGMIAIDSALVFTILERLFGGTGQSMTPRPIRNRFSSIEQRVIRRVIHMFGRSMEAAWRSVIPVTVRHLRIETRPENIPIAAPTDSVASTTFRVTIDDFSASLKLALPLSILEVHKKKLSGVGFDDDRQSDEAWNQNLSALFEQVSVDLVAELGRAHITLGHLLSLRIGDVIRLEQSPEDPISVSIEGIQKFSGQPTVHHGNLAVVVEDPKTTPINGQTPPSLR